MAYHFGWKWSMEAEGRTLDKAAQPWASALSAAQVRARAAVLAGEIPWFEADDLEQEALFASWRALPQFDPSRASLRTFLERVIANRLASVRRYRNCRPRFEPLNTHQCAIGDGWAQRIELHSDLSRALAALQESDRLIALALAQYSPTEVSRRLGLARSSVYTSIRRIRIVFEREGLTPRRYGSGDHLREPCAGKEAR
jgi:RNA polymerase sigma-70 factor, ECF subfamily